MRYLLVLVFLLLPCTSFASTYYSNYGTSSYSHIESGYYVYENYITVSPGSHKFEINGTPFRVTSWDYSFVDINWTTLASGSAVTDPDYTYALNSDGSYVLRGYIWGSRNERHDWYITVYTPKPDLTVSSISGTSSSYNVGGSISATATIKNIGDGSAAGSNLKYYLGTSTNKTYKYIEQGSVGGLSPNGTANDSINIGGYTIPSDVSAGTYYIWVQADSSGQVSESNESNNWANSASFAVIIPNYAPTKPGPPVASNVTQTSARISWVSSTDANSDVITYEIKHKTDGGLLWPSTPLRTTSNFVNISGLNPDTVYDVMLRACDPQNGCSDWTTDGSDEENVITTAPTNSAPTKPGPPGASNVTQTQAHVSWTGSTDADNDVVTYEIKYKTDGGLLWPSTPLRTTSNFVDISGLNPDTVYDVMLRACDPQNACSDWTTDGADEENVISTLPTNSAPTKPGPPGASNITQTQARVSWAGSTDADNDLITYEIEYKTDGDIWPWNNDTLTTNNTYVDVSGLDPDTVYDVMLRACDPQNACSGWTTDGGNEENVITTLPINVAPTKPGPPVASNVTQTSARVDWTGSTDADNDTVTYEIEYKTDGALFWSNDSLTTTDTFVNISGLAPDTVYDVMLRACDPLNACSDWTTDGADKENVITTSAESNAGASVQFSINNVAGGVNAAAMVGEWKVILYDQDWTPSFTQAHISSTPSIEFTDLASATGPQYHYEVYLTLNDGLTCGAQQSLCTEYWGGGTLNLPPGSSISASFVRAMPYVMPAPTPDQPVVGPGSNVYLTGQVNNPVAATHDGVYLTTRIGAAAQANSTSVSLAGTTFLSTTSPAPATGGTYTTYYELWFRASGGNNQLIDHGSMPDQMVVDPQITPVSANISAPVLSSVSILGGETLTFSTTVTNTGSLDAPFWVGASIVDENAATYQDLPVQSIEPFLAVGQTSTPLDFVFDSPAGMPAGEYRALVSVWDEFPQEGSKRFAGAEVVFTVAVNDTGLEQYSDAVFLKYGHQAVQANVNFDNDLAAWSINDERVDYGEANTYPAKTTAVWQSLVDNEISGSISHALYAHDRWELKSELIPNFAQYGDDLSPLTSIKRSGHETAAGLNGRIPLIFIHGWQGDDGSANPLGAGAMKHLPEQYWQEFIAFFESNPELNSKFKLYLYKYPSYRHITYNGRMLGEAINNLPEIKDYIDILGGKIAVVGHSMGGLVARSFIEEYGIGSYDSASNSFVSNEYSSDPVSTLITLGTPHHGSPTGIRHWLDTSFFAELQKNLETPGALDLFWDDFDGAVVKKLTESGDLTGVFDNDWYCLDGGHLSGCSGSSKIYFWDQRSTGPGEGLDDFDKHYSNKMGADKVILFNDGTNKGYERLNPWLENLNSKLKSSLSGEVQYRSVKYVLYGGSNIVESSSTLLDPLANTWAGSLSGVAISGTKYPALDFVVPTRSSFLDETGAYSLENSSANVSNKIISEIFDGNLFAAGGGTYQSQSFSWRYFHDYDHDLLRGSSASESDAYRVDRPSDRDIESYARAGIVNHWKDSPSYVDLQQYLSEINIINSRVDTCRSTNFTGPYDLLDCDPLYNVLTEDLAAVEGAIVASTVSVNILTTEGGSISDGASNYGSWIVVDEGSVNNLIAQPDPGYVFSRWETFEDVTIVSYDLTNSSTYFTASNGGSYGSVKAVFARDILPQATGQLLVTFTPSAAIAGSSGWRLASEPVGTSHSSGESLTLDLTQEGYVILFEGDSQWAPRNSLYHVDLIQDQTVNVSVVFDEVVPNTLPVAVDDSLTLIQGQSVVGAVSASDTEGDGLVYSVSSPPSSGQLQLTDQYQGTFLYTANAAFSGNDSFIFLAHDGSGYSNTATVTLVVQADSDFDGVLDSDDTCPGTPTGTVVDAAGCPLPSGDADNDGVADSIDACPGTLPQTTVDASGCPLVADSDNDGVSDSDDTCPGTPAGTAVDAAGCPLPSGDADNDGVADSIDACPGTLPQTTVDASGCPLASGSVITADWRYSRGDLSGTASDESAYGIPTASFAEGWSAPQLSTIVYSASGDIDGDGDFELVVVGGGEVRMYNADGSGAYPAISVPVTSDMRMILEDVDGDGANEILTGTRNSSSLQINIYKYDGAVVANLSRTGGSDSHMWPVAYLGNDRLLVGYTTGYAKDPRGYGLWDISTQTEQWYYDVGPNVGDISVADVDADGDLDFIASMSTPHNGATGNGIGGTGTATTDGDLYTILVDENGNELLVQQLGEDTTGGGNGGNVHTLVDLENDGIYEIVATVAHYSSYPGDSQIRVLNLDGSVRNQVSVGSNISIYYLISDITNDGTKEIVAWSAASGTLSIYDNNLVEVISKISLGNIHGFVAADIDGDKTKEILMRDNTYLRIFNGSDLTLEWSMDMGLTISNIWTSDLDGDSGAEIVVTTSDGVIHVLSGGQIILTDDSDGDGFVDSFDAFPNDPAASVDSDGDGTPDSWNGGMSAVDSTSGLTALDAFPNDPAASVDTDGDGSPDAWNQGMTASDSTTSLLLDVFPADAQEIADFDGDGVGDNGDALPSDPAASVDTDGDGIPDSWNGGMSAVDSTSGLPALDTFPNDPAASVDTDGDGSPDAWNPGMTAADSTTGLQIDPLPNAPAIKQPGIVRDDGGSASSNIFAGSPKVDAEYTFQASIEHDNSIASVWLLLNGYPMAMDCGINPDFSIPGGVACSTATKLGPSFNHSYQIVGLGAPDYDPLATPLIRTGAIPGPAIELLNGPNMVGLAKDVAASGLGLVDLVGSNSVYEWVSNGVTTDTNNGTFAALDNTDFSMPGKGYFVIRDLNATLPDLLDYPEASSPTAAVDLSPGWNIISNPYGGQIRLSDVEVQRDTDLPVTWAEACTKRWLTNSIYTYLGSDWGSAYSFESAGGDPEATLTPWVGYWVYMIRNDADYKLIFTKP